MQFETYKKNKHFYDGLKHHGGTFRDDPLYIKETDYVNLILRAKLDIRKKIADELAILYHLVDLYVKRTNTGLDAYATFFCDKTWETDSGCIFGDKGSATNKELLQEVISKGNLRILFTCMTNFIKSPGITDSTKVKGCDVMWDFFLHSNYYINELEKSKLFGVNLESLNHKKQRFKTMFGYDLAELDEAKLKEYGVFPDWCAASIPIHLSGTRYPVTLSNNLYTGSYAADVKPVSRPTDGEIKKCLKDRQAIRSEMNGIELSPSEMVYINKQNKIKDPTYVETIDQDKLIGSWGIGRCYYKSPNEDTDVYKVSGTSIVTTGKKTQDDKIFDVEMKKKYSKYSIANMSGHTMMIIETLNNFIPNSYSINNIFTVKMCMQRFAYIILGLILWMVPVHHSVNEILMAANVMDVHLYGGWIRAYEYTFTHDSLEHIHQLIHLARMPITKAI
jgi:hypothetical protein